MTIPIIPGPWSFLAGAGQAGGAIGQAINQRRMYEQQQAQQNAQIIANLVARGFVAPEALGSVANQQLFANAGLPGVTPSQVELPQTTVQSRAYGRELGALVPGSPQMQASLGITTPQEIQVRKGQAARARTEEIAQEGITKPQAEVVAGVPSAQVAPLIQGAQAAGARQQTAEAEGLQQIWQNVQKELPKDAQFRTVANYAAVHGLGFLTSLNEMYARLGTERAAENRDKIRLVTTIHSNAVRAFEQATKLWADNLDAEIKRQLSPLGPNADLSAEEQNALRNSITAEYNKTRPKMESFLDDAIRGYDSSREEYNEAVKGIAGVIGGSEQKANRMGQLKALYKSGKYTEEEIMNDPGLSDDQVFQITGKHRPGKQPSKGSKFGEPKEQ